MRCYGRMRVCGIKMAATSGSSAKLYRFPPTRELQTDYDAVVPAVRGRGRHVRELEDYLRRREHEVAVDEAEREYPVIVPPVEILTDVDCTENSQEESWPSKMEGPLLRKIAALRRALYLAGKERKEAENGVKILMQSARESPSAAACVLSRHMPRAPRLEEVVPSDPVRCAESGCGKRALPFSRFCLHHVSSDQDQVLYATCTASEPGSGVCGATVPDFLLNQPLCSKHITKTALETNVQQQKRKTVVSGASRVNKTKGKSQKNKKTKVATTTTTVTKVVVTKSAPAVAASSAAVGLPALSSTSSWSSGESDGENPLTSEAKRPKVAKTVQPPPAQTKAKDPHQLPSLTPEATLNLSLSAPMPSLILPPPLPDIGKFMDDSSSEES